MKFIKQQILQIYTVLKQCDFFKMYNLLVPADLADCADDILSQVKIRKKKEEKNENETVPALRGRSCCFKKIFNYKILETSLQSHSSNSLSSCVNGSIVCESMSICPMFFPSLKIGTTISAFVSMEQLR